MPEKAQARSSGQQCRSSLSR